MLVPASCSSIMIAIYCLPRVIVDGVLSIGYKLKGCCEEEVD